jgi:hypothetical protein
VSASRPSFLRLSFVERYRSLAFRSHRAIANRQCTLYAIVSSPLTMPNASIYPRQRAADWATRRVRMPECPFAGHDWSRPHTLMPTVTNVVENNERQADIHAVDSPFPCFPVQPPTFFDLGPSNSLQCRFLHR